MSPSPPNDSDQLSRLFGLLANRRRRVTLSVLEEGQTSVEALATSIAADELDKPRSRVTDEDRTRVEVALHHVHLPKLQDAGLLTYDSRQFVVVPNDLLLSEEEWTGLSPDTSFPEWLASVHFEPTP
jgi:DNA-binding transcriptional ArsR family regulator